MTANRGFTLGKKALVLGMALLGAANLGFPSVQPAYAVATTPGSGDADAATRAAPRHPGSQSRKFPRDVLHPHGSGRNDHLLQAGVTVKVATQDGEKLLTCGGPDWIVWRPLSRTDKPQRVATARYRSQRPGFPCAYSSAARQTCRAALLLEIQTRVTPRSGGVFYGPVSDGIEVSGHGGGHRGRERKRHPAADGHDPGGAALLPCLDPAERLTDDDLLARLGHAPRRTSRPGTTPGATRRTRSRCRGARAAPRREHGRVRPLGRDHERPPLPSAVDAAGRALHGAHTPRTYAYLFTWRSPRLGRQARRGPRGRGAVRVRNPRRARLARSGGSQVARWQALRADAGCLDRLRAGPAARGRPSFKPGSRTRPTEARRCCWARPARPVDAPYDAERRFWADAVPTRRRPADRRRLSLRHPSRRSGGRAKGVRPGPAVHVHEASIGQLERRADRRESVETLMKALAWR